MDVAFLTIAELGRLYCRQESSPVEATRARLAQIAAHDGAPGWMWGRGQPP